MLEKTLQIDTKTAWVKFAEVPEMCTIGKDVCAMRADCYVLLYDTKQQTTTLHHASGGRKGDGVRCLAGHHTLSLFAFAEMCLRPRIMVFMYPSMSLVTSLAGKSGGGYLSLALMETDLLVSLSMYPKFAVSVWSWRKGERLMWQESGLMDLHQSLRCGLGWPTIACQVAERASTLLLWEVGVCSKMCVLEKYEVKLPDKAHYGGLAWSPEELHIVDTAGSIYTMGRDCKDAQLSLQWRGGNTGVTPAVAWFKGGLVLSGPDTSLQHLKRIAGGWTQLWLLKPTESLVKLESLAFRDILLGMSSRALLYQMHLEAAEPLLVPVQYYGCGFTLSCLLKPTGEHCVTIGRDGTLSVWHTASGTAVAAVSLNHQYLAMVANPSTPYVVLSRSDGALDFFNFYKLSEPQVMDQVWLCSEQLEDVQFISAGRLMVAAAKTLGWLFLLEGRAGRSVEVLSRVEVGGPVADYALLESGGMVLLLVLLASQPCCGAGREVVLYRRQADSRMFSQHGPPLQLCGNYAQLCVWPSAGLRLFAVPHQSKQIHLLQLRESGDEYLLRLNDAGLSCHQLRRFGLSAERRHLLSYGADGLVAMYELPSLAGRAPVATHHRHAGGVTAAVADQQGRYLLCLGYDGSLVCLVTVTEEDNAVDVATPEDSTAAKKVFVPSIQSLYTDSGDPSERRTWLQTQEDVHQMRETMAVSAEKTQIMEDFQLLKKKLASLLEANEISPPERQLPVAEFNLDLEGRARKLLEAEKERDRVQESALALCRAQDELCAAIKKKYWEPMEVKGHVIKGFATPFLVENYPVMPISEHFKEELKHVIGRRRLELAINKNFFQAWVPRTPSSLELELSREQLEMQPDISSLRHVLLDAEQVTAEEAAARYKISGSISHLYVNILPYHHSQYELVTHLQFYHETVLLQDVIQRLRRNFNGMFDKVLDEKKNALMHLRMFNSRLLQIVPQLSNRKYTPTHSLLLKPLEEPHTIMTVKPDEVGVSPYVSPSHQALLDQHAAEEEARRQAELADNFRELALDDMMGGVLDVRWEDEIKKDVPLPKCMVEHTPEEYTEQDLREVKEYEERVRALQVERERYLRMLDQEFERLLKEEKTTMNDFDSKLNGLYQLKLYSDAAVKQEQLKILRARLLCHRRAELDVREEQLLKEEARREEAAGDMQSKLQRLQQVLEEMRVAHESLVARDRQHEKLFRKNIPSDLPTLTLEQLSKAYRRRPKMHQRMLSSAWMVSELSHLCLSTSRPVFLPPEAEDYLKGLDALDNFSGAPPNILEDVWVAVVHSRRLKIESELKVKSSGLEVMETEATVASAQNRLADIKEEVSVLQGQLTEVRAQKLHIVHNQEIQLVMQQGNVEVPLTGSMSDFDDAVLIDRATVENINQVIKEKGKIKLAVMRENANVRRVILHKEWQHRKLRMQIEDLQDHIYTLESIKVSREIQKFLHEKGAGCRVAKGVPVEKEIQHVRKYYEKAVNDLKDQVVQLDQRIQHVRKHNEELDRKVATLNVDVNEQHLQTHPDLEAQEAEAIQRRMSSIVKRSQLVRKIQQQHNEILVMQTELELLRLKTFPTLRYKSYF